MANDELVEAVRDAVFRAQPDWRGTPNLTALDAERITDAVLSVPALAEVIARPPALEVPAVVCAMRRDASVLDLVGQRDQRGATWCMDRIAALYPEAGK